MPAVTLASYRRLLNTFGVIFAAAGPLSDDPVYGGAAGNASALLMGLVAAAVDVAAFVVAACL